MPAQVRQRYDGTATFRLERYRMQENGIPLSAVENTINPANGMTGKIPGTTAYYDPVNDLTVIVDSSSGRVVTVDYGQIKQ